LNDRILGLFIGGTKTLVDNRGEWQSSIARERVDGPTRLEHRGFVGDHATQPYHGSLETAVCIHSQSHYDYWNAMLGMALGPGAVGENLTFEAWDEAYLCIGDILRTGTALIQISAPRIPCENQARYIGQADWIRLTIQELRTGMYARVLEPGTVQVDDLVLLESRPNPDLTVRDLNRCYYQDFNPKLAEDLIAAEGLMAWWQERLRKKLSS
jgi:MOSC domain-containing protein YiiM